MATYLFPTNSEMSEILPEKIARASAERVGFMICPMRDVDTAAVRWTQKDNYAGLQQLRGLGGNPSYVKPIGQLTYEMHPGYYGEMSVIEEAELTLRSENISSSAPVKVTDLVIERQDQLINRELDRLESTIWTLLGTGTFNITSANGVVHTDTYPLQTFTSSVSWSTYATATPIADLRAVKQAYGVGYGVNFGRGATAYMNSITANQMLLNQNSADLKGLRDKFGATFNSLPQIGQVLLDQDLPTIVEYDEGYFSTSTPGGTDPDSILANGGSASTTVGGDGPTAPEPANFVYYIPTGTVIVVGKRATGERTMEYLKTRNLVNNGTPGSYSFIVDRINGVNGERRVGGGIEVHQGHNGGPTVLHPKSVVVMTVT